jgi:methylmalonyl-CoA mutase
MSTFLFDDFEGLTPAGWKQKIQMDLKGADYNETLLWKTDEGIVVRPFYTEEDRNYAHISLPNKGFNICQSIFVDDVTIANKLAVDSLSRGANSIRFTATQPFDASVLLEGINASTVLYFELKFLDTAFMEQLHKAAASFTHFYQIDILGNLAETGNWFKNQQEDIATVASFSQYGNHLSVNTSIYQNAGATMAQQLAYALAQTNEYLEIFGEDIASNIHYQFAVGSNYFFEIAKLRAFRILHESLLKERSIPETSIHVFTQPTLRNKTLYDYNVNLLRTTSESMSAILGGSNTISNVAYDSIYHKSNEFGERIARNQLLILQKEAYLHEAQSFANGSYYIENITKQLADKALTIFKQIEKGGGFLQQLMAGNIQKKINESAEKELQQFNQEKVVLLGTNKLPNKSDRMKDNLELYPFMKKRISKTLIPPIPPKRLAEQQEQQRLETE